MGKQYIGTRDSDADSVNIYWINIPEVFMELTVSYKPNKCTFLECHFCLQDSYLVSLVSTRSLVVWAMSLMIPCKVLEAKTLPADIIDHY